MGTQHVSSAALRVMLERGAQRSPAEVQFRSTKARAVARASGVPERFIHCRLAQAAASKQSLATWGLDGPTGPPA